MSSLGDYLDAFECEVAVEISERGGPMVRSLLASYDAMRETACFTMVRAVREAMERIEARRPAPEPPDVEPAA